MTRPSRPTRTSWRAALILILVVMLAACSVVRLAYNQADKLVYWQLNRAFDFNDTQSVQIHGAIKQWFQWHRRTQLPVYAQFLTRAQKEALAPVPATLACERRTELEALGRKAVDQAVPALADLVLSLSPEQIKHLEAYQDDTNEDFRDDFMQAKASDRDQAATKFLVKWSEVFYGTLDKTQRAQLKQHVAALPLKAQDVYQERLAAQRTFVQTIRRLIAQHATPAQAQQALREMFQQFFEPTHEPQRSQRLQWIASGCQLTSTLHELTTGEQKANAAKRLRTWESDLRLLSTQPS